MAAPPPHWGRPRLIPTTPRPRLYAIRWGSAHPLPRRPRYYPCPARSTPAPWTWQLCNDSTGQGVTPAGVRVVSAKNLAETWFPQVQVTKTLSYGNGLVHRRLPGRCGWSAWWRCVGFKGWLDLCRGQCGFRYLDIAWSRTGLATVSVITS